MLHSNTPFRSFFFQEAVIEGAREFIQIAGI
jgi:hypothetical protein